MANRILRDWTDSERIDKLSFEAEVFFTRLMMKADDFGYYHANPKLLLAALFPLKNIQTETISRLLNECVELDLIFEYEVDGKKYLRINNFGQRLRKMVSKFPPVAVSPPTIDSNPPPETKGNESETNPETEKKEKTHREIFEESIQWKEALCMKHKIKMDELPKFFDDFFLNSITQAKEDQTISDRKAYFDNWLRMFLFKNPRIKKRMDSKL